jgi:D-alanyl-lipoteichoic acid acyltransferase DltB (MBOAT superfamily)
MAFNSTVFAVFFVLVYGGYLLLRRSVRGQNALLLVASYVFYGWWDWRFCGLLAASTVIDYAVGRAMHASEDPKRRKHLLWVSLCANLGMLGFFKYFDFFANSVKDGLNAFGMEANPVLLEVVLPVGISFYTFQTLSYTIDIYRRKLEPTKDFLAFALFVSFFPQLVAGPIERASHLLPQMLRPRKFDLPEFHAGLYLILWGLFKKIVIADNMAPICNDVYQSYWEHQGLTVLLATVAFAFQIYCDFSAYSDIARGCGKLLGFDLMVNFRLPYFAVSPSDFWRRWHISLSTWLRDYLYIPLGGNRGSKFNTQRNLMLTMLLGGLWHGASWNFVLWGFFHGLILAIYRIADKRPIDAPVKTMADRFSFFSRLAIMTVLTLIGWVLFRATGVFDAEGNLTHGSLAQIGHMLTAWATLDDLRPGLTMAYQVGFFALPLVVVQVVQYRSRDMMIMTRLPVVPRGIWYGLLVAGIFVLGAREPVEFIYFQF